MSLRKWEVGEARGSHILNYYSVKAKFFSLPLSRYLVHRHLLYLLVRSGIGTLSTMPLTTLDRVIIDLRRFLRGWVLYAMSIEPQQAKMTPCQS
jgi:hypothetical protein